jgi:hypothetical protein
MKGHFADTAEQVRQIVPRPASWRAPVGRHAAGLVTDWKAGVIPHGERLEVDFQGGELTSTTACPTGTTGRDESLFDSSIHNICYQTLFSGRRHARHGRLIQRFPDAALVALMVASEPAQELPRTILAERGPVRSHAPGLAGDDGQLGEAAWADPS